jgi:hypothetical protein
MFGGSSIRALFLGILLVVVLFGAYFLLYIAHRERLLADHELRLLSGSGDYISDTLAGLLTNVRNAVAPGRIQEGTAATRSLTWKDAQEKLALIQGLRPMTGPADTDSSAGRLESYDFRPVRLVVTLAQRTDPRLLFMLTHPQGHGTWESDLRAILAPTFPKESFCNVSLVRADGEVLFETGESPMRLRRFDLPRPKGEKGKQPALAGSEVLDLTLAGQAYKCFVQPVRIPMVIHLRRPDGGWNREDGWFLVGFIPVGQFRTMAMAISPSVALATIGLILIGLLLMPLLKVQFMGPRDALPYRDLRILAIATIMGGAFFAVAGLFFVMHEQNTDRVQLNLANLACQITCELHDELDELDTSLVSWTERRLARRAFRGASREQTLQPGRSAPAIRASVTASPGAAAFSSSVEMAAWIGADGWQNVKWTIHDEATPVVNVGQRQYFRDAVDGRLWTWGRAQDSLYLPGHVVESVRSITTGKESAFLARCYAQPIDPPNRIGVVESRLWSVIGPTLPPNQGFAVVDEDGMVQFHSDRIRNVRENLYQELGSDGAIRASVRARKAAFAKTTYQTIPRVLHVSPLPGTPWSLVVFEDIRAARHWMIEVLGLTLFLLALYAAVMLLGAWLMSKAFPSERQPGQARSLWFWPDPAVAPRYRALATVLFAFGFLWAVCMGLGELTLLCATLTLPLANIGVIRAILTRCPPDESPKPIRPHRAYSLLLFVAVVLLGVLPAVSLFRIAHDEIRIAVLEEDQRTFLRDGREHVEDRRRSFDDVALNAASREALLPDLFGTAERPPRGVYVPFGWSWRTGGRGPDGNAPTLLVLETVGSALARLGALAAPILERESRADSEYVSRLGPAGDMALTSRDHASLGRLGAGKDSAVSGPSIITLQGPVHDLDLWDPSVWLIAALGAWLLSRVISVIMRQVFLDCISQAEISGEDVVKSKDPVLIQAEGTTRAIFLRCDVPAALRRNLKVIDTQALDRPRLVRGLVNQADGAGVLLRHLDRGLKEPRSIQCKLALIEALESKGMDTIYIESAIEPLYFLTERFQEHHAERGTLGISIERWSVALQKYVRIRRNPREEYRAQVANRDFEGLDKECSSTGVLVSVARHIVKCYPDGMDRKRLVQRVGDLAHAHYRRMWTTCSTEEKLLLYRVATGSLVHRGARDAVRPLIRRRFVLLDPSWRLMNESFRCFVLTAERSEVIAKWQRRGEVSSWGRMKTPILVAFALLAVFFFATQREALNQTLGLVAAITAVTPALINTISGLARPKTSP